jgi:phosphatidylinositol alpha 1,6-mannosyltransferase
MSLRVAIVTESFLPQLNGVTNSVLRVCDTLHEQGHEAIIVAPSNGIADLSLEREYRGFRIIRVPSLPFRQFPVGMPSPFLARILSQFSPDVMHVASPFVLGGAAIGVARRLGIPTVAIYQTDLAGYSDRYGVPFVRTVADRLVASIHGNADINLAPTPESALYLTQLGAPNVSVWGRGVDISRFHPNLKNEPETVALREKLTQGRRHLVGYVGRLAPEKQVHRFKELADMRDTAFVVVGDGAERARLERDLPDKAFTFLGSQSGDDLARAYAAMDVFVHFGAEETFGQTLQEAQASGVPVVSPDAGGPKYLIDNGETGFLVDPDDKHITRRAVRFLLRDDALRARMGEAGRRKMLTRTWEANNERLIAHYQSALTQRAFETTTSDELV